MRSFGNVSFALFTAIIVTGLLVFGLGSGGRNESSEPIKKAPVLPPPPVEQAKAIEPVVESPKELPKPEPVAEEKPAKPAELSLAEAILIAEKLGKARAVKAERSERPTLSFKIDLVNWEGNKSTLELNGDGKLRELTKGGTLAGGNKKKRIDR